MLQVSLICTREVSKNLESESTDQSIQLQRRNKNQLIPQTTLAPLSSDEQMLVPHFILQLGRHSGNRRLLHPDRRHHRPGHRLYPLSGPHVRKFLSGHRLHARPVLHRHEELCLRLLGFDKQGTSHRGHQSQTITWKSVCPDGKFIISLYGYSFKTIKIGTKVIFFAKVLWKFCQMLYKPSKYYLIILSFRQIW